MAEDHAAVDGSYLSALPDKPPRWNTTIPEALSASEGSGQGVPACSNAVPEAQPLTGELRDDPTTSSTNHHDGNSELGQDCALTPGHQSSPFQRAGSIGLQRTGGQAAAVRVDTPTASTLLSKSHVSFLPTTLGGRSRSSPPRSKDSAIQKSVRAAKHLPPKPNALDRSPDGGAGESSGAARYQPFTLGIQRGRAPLSCEKHSDTAVGALPPTYLPTTQTIVPGRLDSGGATIGILRELPVLPEKGVGTQGMLGACGLRRGTTPEHHTHTDLNLNLTLPGTIPGGQGRSGVTRGILRESPDSAASLRPGSPWIEFRPSGTPEVGQTPLRLFSPVAPLASAALATSADHRANPPLQSPPLPAKPASLAEFPLNSASRSPPVSSATLLAFQPPAGAVSVADTGRSALAAAALATSADHQAFPPSQSPPLPTKSASLAEFPPNSASRSSLVSPATLLAFQPPAGSVGVADTSRSAFASAAHAASPDYQAIPPLPLSLPAKPASLAEFPPNSASRSPPVSPATLLAFQPPAGAVSVADTSRSALAAAALATSADHQAFPPSQSPPLPTKPASLAEFPPNSASRSSLVPPATLLAFQPPAGSVSVADTSRSAFASSALAASSDHRAIPPLPLSLPAKPASLAEFPPNPASRSPLVSPATLLAFQPLAGSVSVADTSRSALASAAFATSADPRAIPPSPSPPLPAKPASLAEFPPNSASSASIAGTSRFRSTPTADPHGAASATLLASQPPASSVSVEMRVPLQNFSELLEEVSEDDSGDDGSPPGLVSEEESDDESSDGDDSLQGDPAMLPATTLQPGVARNPYLASAPGADSQGPLRPPTGPARAAAQHTLMPPTSRFPAGLSPAAAQMTSDAAPPPSAPRPSPPPADGGVANVTYVQPQPTPLEQQKQQLGEQLFPLVRVIAPRLASGITGRPSAIAPRLAGKITGMLLELDISELLHLLESPEALTAKIEEALSVLRVGGAEVWVENAGQSLASRDFSPSEEGYLEHSARALPPVSHTRGRTPSPPNEHGIAPPVLPTAMLALLPSDLAGDRLIDGSVVLNAHKPPSKQKTARPLLPLLSRVQKSRNARQLANSTAPSAAVTFRSLTPASRGVQEIDSSDGGPGDEESSGVNALLPPSGGPAARSEEGVAPLSSSPPLGLTWPSEEGSSAEEAARLKRAKKALKAKEARAAKKLLSSALPMTASLIPAAAVESGHTTEEDEDDALTVAEPASALPEPASQSSDQGGTRLRRLSDKFPLVDPVPGAPPAHGRRLSAAFSAASDGTTVLPEKASSQKPSLSVHATLPTAPHARVAFVTPGTVSATSLEVDRPEAASAGSDDLIPDSQTPAFPLGTYVQVKHTSHSQTAKGRVMLVESVKDGVYHLSHIGDTGAKKKGKIQGRFLQPVDRSALNIVAYNNLVVQDPTLPAALPAPTEVDPLTGAQPPTPGTVVPERPPSLLSRFALGSASTGGRHISLPPAGQPNPPPSPPRQGSGTPIPADGNGPWVTVTQGIPPRRSSSLTPSDVTDRTSGEEPACFSAQSSASSLSCRGSDSPLQDQGGALSRVVGHPAEVTVTPAPRRVSTAPSSAASASSTSSVAPTGMLPDEAPAVPKRLPGKNAKATTLSPLDERFQPPVAGSVHYRDAKGTLHVIVAPGVELPAAYDKAGVIIETVAEAIAIHVAARTAAAAAINVAAAEARLDAKPSNSSISGAPSVADSSSLSSTRMQYVLPKSLTSRKEQALALQIIADLGKEAALAQQEREAGDAELKDSLEQNEVLIRELSAERDRLSASEFLVKALTSERDRVPAADSELQYQWLETEIKAKDQVILELERRLDAVKEKVGKATYIRVACLESELASWMEECRTHQAEALHYRAAESKAESALQSERTAAQEIIAGYSDAKDDILAEYRELEAHTAQLKEALAAATKDTPPAGTEVVALQAYRELEQSASDAFAAAQFLIQKHSTDELTAVTALQAERLTHQEAIVGYRDMNASYVAEYRELQLRGAQLEEALTLATAAAAEANQGLDLATAAAADYGTRSAQLEAALDAQEEERRVLVELHLGERDQHRLELKAAVAELHYERAEYRSDTARSPRLTSVLEDLPAATDPCDEDCERKLAASERSRNIQEEQMRGMLSEIEALRELLEETRTQHALDHATAAAHALKFAEELELRDEGVHDTAELQHALVATQERVQQLERLLETSVSELAASQRLHRHEKLGHEYATREATEKLAGRCPHPALECQRRTASLQQELKSAAADCEVHKAALQKELSELRDTAERFVESAAQLSDTVATQKHQLGELQKDLLDMDHRNHDAEEELGAAREDLSASQQLNESHDGVLQEEVDRGIALRRADKDRFKVAMEKEKASLLVCQKLVDSLQSAAETAAADEDQRVGRLEAQAKTLIVTRRELKLAKTQKETADKDYHSVLDELTEARSEYLAESLKEQEDNARLRVTIEQLRSQLLTGASSDHLEETSRLQEECTRLRATIEQLGLDLRRCTTCSPTGAAEDTCPALLAAAMLQLQQAEARFRVLDKGYDDLRAAADAHIATLETDLATARSARDSDSAADHVRLERIGAALDESDHRLRQSQADARTIQEELSRLTQVIADQRLAHLFYGNRGTLLLGNSQPPPLPDTPGRPPPDADPFLPGYDAPTRDLPPPVDPTEPPCELTSGSMTCGFTARESAVIRQAVANHSMAADIELVLKSTPDSMQGKTTHRICFRRYVKVRGADPKSGGITLQSILDGKVRFFTNRLVDTKQAGWNRGTEWRGHGIGSRVAMQNRLANAVNNGAPWMNIRSAMAAQVRDYAQATGALQDSLIRAFDVVSNFAESFYVDSGPQQWPVTFLLELLFFQLDTVIAGPSTNASNDAKRNLEAAVPSGDIVSSSRLYEELQLAVKDPEGKKKMTMKQFYADQTCVEEIHEGFVALYNASPEHQNIMVHIHAEFAQRRLDVSNQSLPNHVYLGICTMAEKWLTMESAVRHLGPTPSRPRAAREARDTTQRVNAIDAAALEDVMARVAAVEQRSDAGNEVTLEEVVARVAAVEQGRFRSGGGASGGAQPPYHGAQPGTPTAAAALKGSLFDSARGLVPVSSVDRPPSQSGYDSDTFVGKDGIRRWAGIGMPEVRINEAVEALKGAVLPRVLSIKHLNVPEGCDVNKFLAICRFEPYLVDRLWDNGNCTEAVKKALAFISPAHPYGGEGEAKEPVYSEERKTMTKNTDGSESWKIKSCLHCAHAPPWNKAHGPPPQPNTPAALVFRNGVSSEHNPKPCPGRMVAGLTTECQPLIECIRPNPVKLSEMGF